MHTNAVEAIELCRRVLTNPHHVEDARWGEDFIAHRIAEHPEIAPLVSRLRAETRPRAPR